MGERKGWTKKNERVCLFDKCDPSIDRSIDRRILKQHNNASATFSSHLATFIRSLTQCNSNERPFFALSAFLRLSVHFVAGPEQHWINQLLFIYVVIAYCCRMMINSKYCLYWCRYCCLLLLIHTFFTSNTFV